MGAHWGTVYCTYRGHWPPAGTRGGWAEKQQTDRGHTHSGALSTVHTEDTENQSDRGTLGHCNIQRAMATRLRTVWQPKGDWEQGTQRANTTRQTAPPLTLGKQGEMGE